MSGLPVCLFLPTCIDEEGHEDGAEIESWWSISIQVYSITVPIVLVEVGLCRYKERYREDSLKANFSYRSKIWSRFSSFPINPAHSKH